ncbi:hypothetical protein MRX96_022099 [Rhipicephalus microplus]
MLGGHKKRRRIATSGLEQCSSSGGGTNYRAPCTSAEGRPCDIFENLRFWNAFLCSVGLKLREFHPGQLSLIETSREIVFTLEGQQHQRKVTTLLRHLLRYHHCLVAVHLEYCILMAHHRLICNALVKSPSLRKLRLGLLSANPRVLRSFAVALPRLKNLEELECLIYEEETFARASQSSW